MLQRFEIELRPFIEEVRNMSPPDHRAMKMCPCRGETTRPIRRLSLNLVRACP
jgi:hypothetical protein